MGTWLRVAAVGVIATMVVFLGAPLAGAHTGDQSYIYLDVTEDSLGGTVDLPFGDVEEILGLDLSGGDGAARAVLEANLETVQAYAADHLAIDGGSKPVSFEGLDLLIEGDVDYVRLPFVVDLAGGDVPRNFDVMFDPFFDDIPGRDALALIGNDWRGGVIGNEENVLLAFDDDTRSRAIDLGEGGWWKTVAASVELGLDHIRTGPDHIFFILVLLAPSVLVFQDGWKAAPSFGSALWRVLKIATMFTIAHSVTFTLAGLDLVPLPSSKLVETIIAVSIVVAAILNLRPIAGNREWMLAFGFGLFHGLGFASLVSGLEVSSSTKLLSLLGRNLGIELGQMLVILLVFPGLFLLRRTWLYRPAFMLGSVALALIASVWTIERIFETSLGIDSLVDKLIRFPRSAGLAVLFALAAGGFQWFEARRDALEPVAAAS